MMKRIFLLYILLLASFSFLVVACGYNTEYESKYKSQLPGVWIAKRLPQVEGLSIEEYVRTMQLLPIDSDARTIYSFRQNGRLSYYPFVQERGVYVPGNKLEGRWTIRGNTLYIAQGTFPLIPMYEVAFTDSSLVLRQTRQMQQDYLEALISACNDRLDRNANQHQLEIVNCKTILANAQDMQRRIARLHGDYAVSRNYTLRETEPTEEDTDLEMAVEIPSKEQKPRYAE